MADDINDMARPDGPGSHPSDQAPAGLGASRFDPSRMEGPSVFWTADVVAAILDHKEAENASREDFTPAISRKTVETAINQLFALYECRREDFAAAYGWTGLWTALGVDWSAGIPFLPRDSDRSGEASETPHGGSTVGESAGCQASPTQSGQE